MPCHLLLNHLHWTRRHLYLNFILAPAASTVLLVWTEKSLSHLVGGPGPQDSQAKNGTLTVSNMLLQGHNSFQRKAAIRREIWELYKQFWYWTKKFRNFTPLYISALQLSQVTQLSSGDFSFLELRLHSNHDFQRWESYLWPAQPRWHQIPFKWAIPVAILIWARSSPSEESTKSTCYIVHEIQWTSFWLSKLYILT